MMGWFRRWRDNVAARRKAAEAAYAASEQARKANVAAIFEAERQANERRKFYRACLRVAAETDNPTVRTQAEVLLLLADFPGRPHHFAYTLIHRLPTDKKVLDALEKLAICVRLAHAEDLLPERMADDAAWCAAEKDWKYQIYNDDQHKAWLRVANGPMRKLVV